MLRFGEAWPHVESPTTCHCRSLNVCDWFEWSLLVNHYFGSILVRSVVYVFIKFNAELNFLFETYRVSPNIATLKITPVWVSCSVDGLVTTMVPAFQCLVTAPAPCQAGGKLRFLLRWCTHSRRVNSQARIPPTLRAFYTSPFPLVSYEFFHCYASSKIK